MDSPDDKMWAHKLANLKDSHGGEVPRQHKRRFKRKVNPVTVTSDSADLYSQMDQGYLNGSANNTISNLEQRTQQSREAPFGSRQEVEANPVARPHQSGTSD